MVVILDSLALQDLRLYKGIIASMPESEKACGFISGKEELQSWSPADLFQFYYETAALYGELHSLIAAPRQKDIEASVKSAAEALYHQAVHGYLYDRNLFESLKQLYKMSFFIIQAQYFLKQGIYIPVKKELLPLLSGRDKDVLENSMNRDCIKD